jgi:hypothetical protein
MGRNIEEDQVNEKLNIERFLSKERTLYWKKIGLNMNRMVDEFYSNVNIVLGVKRTF